jgi:hypothetical protein
MGFPTYGMAGIGIAAAIGFVFALSFLGSNNGAVDDGQLLQSAPADEQQRMAEPLADQEAGDTLQAKNVPEEEAESAPAGSAMMTMGANPMVSSVVALDGSRELIGEVVPGTEFKVGQPIILQISISSQSESITHGNSVTMGIRDISAEQGQAQPVPFVGAAHMQGDIAPNNSALLELYWTPARAGDYDLLVYVGGAELTAPDEAIEPASAIPITVK